MPSTRLVPVGGIRHTLAEPGETQVAVRYEVDAASGRVHLTARYAGATDAPTLPAFGLEWTLPKQYENLRFYGLAPEETYHDRLHGGKLGCFASMFVRQVRQCFSAVWADGFPRCRHRFPVM